LHFPPASAIVLPGVLAPAVVDPRMVVSPGRRASRLYASGSTRVPGTLGASPQGSSVLCCPWASRWLTTGPPAAASQRRGPLLLPGASAPLALALASPSLVSRGWPYRPLASLASHHRGCVALY